MTAFQLLEFERIRDEIGRYASCEGTVADILAMTPWTDSEVLRKEKTGVAEVLRRLEEGIALPRSTVIDLEPLFDEVAREGAVLGPEDLIEIVRFLGYAEQMLRFCRGEETPILGNRVSTVVFPAAVYQELQRTITDDGQVAEHAIPELRQIRSEIGRINRDLMKRSDELIRSAREMYHGEQPTIRDGRTVLPLAVNFKGRIDGIIHESSGSGETLFVEPRELVDLNNDLTQAHHAIHREIRRVMRELSAGVRSELAPIRELYRIVLSVDSVFARASWGHNHQGAIIDIGETINLREARHPLLGDACVPLTVGIESGVRLLVISGPNTGGKTVLIKTVGLLSILHQCAVPIPAEPDSTLPVFDYWGVDIGDEQSIDEKLSTFSAHMRRIAEILANASEAGLILLDELGTGTDPDEGAALSMAIIDDLVNRDCTVLVSTHQTVLKHYGYTRPGARNVSMAFDSNTHRPTYRVVAGRPGASHAIETAAEQGVPGEIVSAAQRYATDQENSVSEIINRLLEQEDALQQRLGEANARERQLEAAHAELLERSAKLDEREAELRKGALRELDQTLRNARRSVEREVKRLRERGHAIERSEILAVQERLREIDSVRDGEADAIDRLERDRSLSDANANGSGDTAPIKKSSRVRHIRTGKEGAVKTVRGSRVEVQFGAVRMTLPREELEIIPASDTDSAREHSVTGAVTTSRRGTAVFELDIRGSRLHEAIEELERQVDDAILQGLHAFSVIHGTGTGVLQKGVQDYLEQRSEVASYRFARPEDGGFGKTMVELSSGSG